MTAELPIDYVPPFRGNAIRVLDRKRKPRDLEIDFAALDQRRAREFEKLERMVRYAQSNKCRRAFLLGYFGDAAADRVHCGRCDNCGDKGERPPTPSATINTPAGREVILKILSGVARTKGRFGKTVVAQMLRGSDSEKLRNNGLKELSTFGILPKFTDAELVMTIDALTASGLIEAVDVDHFRPIIKLSERGWELLKTKDGPPITLPLGEPLASKVRRGDADRPPAKAESATAETPGGSLLDSLRALRKKLADETNLSPAYVFSNETLDELVRVRPQSPRELAGVKGFGPVKLERYGAAILNVIATTSDTAPALPAATVAAPPTPTPTPPPTIPVRVEPPKPVVPAPVINGAAYVPTEEWTRRLLERGFTLDEAAAIRGLDRSAVVRHLTLAARSGKTIDPRSFLDAAILERWNAWRSTHGDATPPVDEGPSDLWGLFVACREKKV